MTQEVKILSIIGVITLAILAGGIFFLSRSGSTNPKTQAPVDSKLLVKSDSHVLNEASTSAQVTVVEFGDYQCPACGQSYPIVKQILKDYQGKIKFVFRNFPLTQHQNAQIAAEAAEASGAQGKYWEMYDKLYQAQNTWAESGTPLEIFVGYAKDLGLDVEKFKSEVSSNKYADKITQDQSDGSALGVNETPTFFINNIKYPGVLSYTDMKSKIDAATPK